MTDFLDNWGLILITFLPLVGALVMMVVPKEAEDTHKALAIVASGAALVITILLLANFDYDDAGTLQFLVDKEWIPLINSGFILGLDGISLPLVAMTALVVPLVAIYSWNHIPEPGNPKAFMALILILETGMIGSFVAQDLILFFVFFEIVLLPMYFMIGVWGSPERKYASIKFFVCDVRLRPDARVVHGAVLPVPRAEPST